MIEKEKNTAVYTHEEVIMDSVTGEIVSETRKTVTKTSVEPDFIKVYYETMMAFNQIHDIPTSFVLSLSKFLEWTNDGKPQYATLNRRIKEIMRVDCNVSLPQIDRYIRKAVENGLLFRTPYRSVYEVNPFMIARGKWDSIKKLRSNYDFIEGKWERITEFSQEEVDCSVKQKDNKQQEHATVCESVETSVGASCRRMGGDTEGHQLEIFDTDMHIREA